MLKNVIYLFLFLLSGFTYAENYPDRFYAIEQDQLEVYIESANGVFYDAADQCLKLQNTFRQGSITLVPDSSDVLFDRGLPSWNGTVQAEGSGFLVQMRFPYGSGWSPWLTVGYWKDYIWNGYGSTSYAGGEIDYDYVKLDSYEQKWQFKIYMLRDAISDPSPELKQISFYTSDSRTTDDFNLLDVLNDNPPEIFISTDFLYQYDIDDDIGGRICSPTTVSMILKSYQIEVDPLQFASDTYDSYFDLFGIWPRVVQNASEYGLEGSVHRFRNWSAAQEVLANGGRVAMSVGPPLYSGHLMMLAGFTSNGTPLVHDPARSNGYAYQYSKSDLSRSWFEKGGIGYAFFPADSQTVAIAEQEANVVPRFLELYQNYPNPFNGITRISYYLSQASHTKISVFGQTGQIVDIIQDQFSPVGNSILTWNASGLASGTYFIRISANGHAQTIKVILLN